MVCKLILKPLSKIKKGFSHGKVFNTQKCVQIQVNATKINEASKEKGTILELFYRYKGTGKLKSNVSCNYLSFRNGFWKPVSYPFVSLIVPQYYTTLKYFGSKNESVRKLYYVPLFCHVVQNTHSHQSCVKI